MEFDRSKVYTSVNADELRAGDKVIAAHQLGNLKYQVSQKDYYVQQDYNVWTIKEIKGETYSDRFVTVNGAFPLVYLVERAKNCTNCGEGRWDAEHKKILCDPAHCGNGNVVFRNHEIEVCEYWKPKTKCTDCAKSKNGGRGARVLEESYRCDDYEKKAENCTNCVYEGSAGCSVVEICGENKSTHRCHMYEAKDTKRNLCNSCKHSFAECPATTDDIIFGDGVGNDNVYECDKYERRLEHDCQSCKYINCGFKYLNTKNDCDRWEAEKHYRPFKDTDELIKVWEEKIGATSYWGKGADLVMPHIWVRSKFNKDHKGVLINNYFGKYVELGKVQCFLSRLFDEYVFLDGSPCGVEE